MKEGTYMKQHKKLFWIIGISVLVLALAAVGVFGFLLPYTGAAGVFPEDRTVTFYQRSDGRLQMSWPAGLEADRYFLEVLIPQDGVPSEDWQVAYSADIQDRTDHILLPMTGEQRAIRLRIAKEYKLLFDREPRLRLSKDAIFLTDTFLAPSAPVVNWEPDPDSDTVSATLILDPNCSARAFFLTQSAFEPFAEDLHGQTSLTFGEGKQFPLPKRDQTYEFAFDACRKAEGFVFYSTKTQAITLTRDDLLSLFVNLSVSENPDNTYTLSWGEAQGDYYKLQTRPDKNEKWEDLAQYDFDDNLTYTTEAFAPYTSREYRVITYRTEDTKEKEVISSSDTLPVKTASVLTYATIWPIKELPVFSDAAKTQEIGKAAAGKAFCILALEEGLFRIRLEKDTYGYIDSNYCMINLPEFLGGLLEYDIANSYASLFNFHGVPIEGVTGATVIGYERIMLEEDSYLVPYLYPSALKLEKAGATAREKGYALKIFDSFRPQEATKDLYARMVDKCPTPIPLPTAMPSYNNKPADETISDMPEIPEPLDPAYLAQFVKADGTPLTYQEFITNNNRYKLNYFLANGTSRHNRGAALDLTLTKNGVEMEMQTIIHDLCWYSETARNTTAAKTLASIMKSAGFGGLVSEWWHFQDDDALKNLDLPALKNGVTPEGWVADGTGWRYRQADGQFYKNTKKKIDGATYSFDAKGYVSAATS